MIRKSDRDPEAFPEHPPAGSVDDGPIGVSPEGGGAGLGAAAAPGGPEIEAGGEVAAEDPAPRRAAAARPRRRVPSGGRLRAVTGRIERADPRAEGADALGAGEREGGGEADGRALAGAAQADDGAGTGGASHASDAADASEAGKDGEAAEAAEGAEGGAAGDRAESGCEGGGDAESEGEGEGEGDGRGRRAPVAPELPLTARVEALLFATGDALAPARLARLLGEATDDVRSALAELSRSWAEREGAIELVQIAGGYRFMTRPAFHEVVQQLARKGGVERLSPAALETLAIVAYRQPLTRAEIEAVRGVAAGPLLRVLLDRDLIRVAGRASEPGHPLLYGTTKRFLDHFGLGSLKQLPDLKEILESR